MRCYRAPVQLTVIHVHSTMLACDISPRPLQFFNLLDTDGGAPPIYGRDTAPHRTSVLPALPLLCNRSRSGTSPSQHPCSSRTQLDQPCPGTYQDRSPVHQSLGRGGCGLLKTIKNIYKNKTESARKRKRKEGRGSLRGERHEIECNDDEE